MKNETLFKVLNTLIWVGIGALIMYLYMRPSEDLSPIKPVQTTVQETEAKVKPVEALVIKLEGEKQLIRDSVAVFKSKWREAISEVNRLKKNVGNLPQKMNFPTEPPLKSEGTFQQNGTAEDYTETLIETGNATIEAMELQQIKTDSLYQSQKLISAIFKQGFEEMTAAASARELQIKSINKKLKWQKVQNVGMKAVIIGAAVLIIKNNL